MGGATSVKSARQYDPARPDPERGQPAPATREDGENPDRTAGSSIYPAVQNMLLATRALGLGTTLTTRHTGYGKEVDAIFGLPAGVHSYPILPIGWPMGRAGSVLWAVGRSKMSSFRTSGAKLTRGFELRYCERHCHGKRGVIGE